MGRIDPQGLHDAHEDERNRHHHAKRLKAFERNSKARERGINTLVGPRCDHLPADAEWGTDPGIDQTGFSDGLI